MASQTVRNLTGRLSVWAQVNHPVATSNLMRKLTSSSSHKKGYKKSAEASAEFSKIAGLEAADAAARIPHPVTLDDRHNGIALANRAARIPGTY